MGDRANVVASRFQGSGQGRIAPRFVPDDENHSTAVIVPGHAGRGCAHPIRRGNPYQGPRDLRHASYGAGASAARRVACGVASNSLWTDRSHVELISDPRATRISRMMRTRSAPATKDAGYRSSMTSSCVCFVKYDVVTNIPYCPRVRRATRRETSFGPTAVERAYRLASPRNGISYWIGGGKVNEPTKSKPPSPVGRVRVMLCRTSSSSRNSETTAASNPVGVK